ncbi:hypothetical protein QVD99_004405 [Batrachochytrium dendrobatidis]|nr:hypothetical protein O5D80_002470 [Batrachochytrium dendrobatidis]KAK5668611.1 hypothetical protein QVD99_004405 [Batrachochytrium dendrobatidis]
METYSHNSKQLKNHSKYPGQHADLLDEYHAHIVQQPVFTRCSGVSNNGSITYPIEPCIAVQLVKISDSNKRNPRILNPETLVAQAYLVSVDETTYMSYYAHPVTFPSTEYLKMDPGLSTTAQEQQPKDEQLKSEHEQSKDEEPKKIIVNRLKRQSLPSNSSEYSNRQVNSTSIDAGFGDPSSKHPKVRSGKNYTQEFPSFNHIADKLPRPSLFSSPMSSTHYNVDQVNFESKLDATSQFIPPTPQTAVSDSKTAKNNLEWKDITSRVLMNRPIQTQMSTLCGNQTAAADIATDLNNNRGVFFFFPDLGIRIPGKFKIRIIISRIQLDESQRDELISPKNTILTEVVTNAFISHSPNSWAGHHAPTQLSKHFSRQGVRIPLFKTRRN